MLRTPNFGRKSLNEIKEVLTQMGLHLGMEVAGLAPGEYRRAGKEARRAPIRGRPRSGTECIDMRHRMSGRKLGRTRAATARRCSPTWRRALIKHEQIKTTLPKAKDLRSVVDKLITPRQAGQPPRPASGHERSARPRPDRQAYRYSRPALRGAPRPATTRVLRSGFRYGDAAPMAYNRACGRAIRRAKGLDSGPVPGEGRRGSRFLGRLGLEATGRGGSRRGCLFRFRVIEWCSHSLGLLEKMVTTASRRAGLQPCIARQVRYGAWPRRPLCALGLLWVPAGAAEKVLPGLDCGAGAVLRTHPSSKRPRRRSSTFMPPRRRSSSARPSSTTHSSASSLAMSSPRDPVGPGQNSLGSGVIIRIDGLIVTNYHVVKDADAINVVLADRREFPAQVLRLDERHRSGGAQDRCGGGGAAAPFSSSWTRTKSRLAIWSSPSAIRSVSGRR